MSNTQIISFSVEDYETGTIIFLTDAGKEIQRFPSGSPVGASDCCGLVIKYVPAPSEKKAFSVHFELKQNIVKVVGDNPSMACPVVLGGDSSISFSTPTPLRQYYDVDLLTPTQERIRLCHVSTTPLESATCTWFVNSSVIPANPDLEYQVVVHPADQPLHLLTWEARSALFHILPKAVTVSAVAFHFERAALKGSIPLMGDVTIEWAGFPKSLPVAYRIDLVDSQSGLVLFPIVASTSTTGVIGYHWHVLTSVQPGETVAIQVSSISDPSYVGITEPIAVVAGAIYLPDDQTVWDGTKTVRWVGFPVDLYPRLSLKFTNPDLTVSYELYNKVNNTGMSLPVTMPCVLGGSNWRVVISGWPARSGALPTVVSSLPFSINRRFQPTYPASSYIAGEMLSVSWFCLGCPGTMDVVLFHDNEDMEIVATNTPISKDLDTMTLYQKSDTSWPSSRNYYYLFTTSSFGTFSWRSDPFTILNGMDVSCMPNGTSTVTAPAGNLTGVCGLFFPNCPWLIQPRVPQDGKSYCLHITIHIYPVAMQALYIYDGADSNAPILYASPNRLETRTEPGQYWTSGPVGVVLYSPKMRSDQVHAEYELVDVSLRPFNWTWIIVGMILGILGIGIASCCFFFCFRRKRGMGYTIVTTSDDSVQ